MSSSTTQSETRHSFSRSLVTTRKTRHAQTNKRALTTHQYNTNQTDTPTHPDAPRTPHAATTGPTPLRRCLIEDDNDDDGDTNDIDIVGGADITDIDNSVHEALMRRTNDNSKPAYMRLWRYWCVFNTLVLNLELRSVWRSYDGLPDTETKRRDERDLMRFATWLCRRFTRSATAAQGVSMVRSTHRARAGRTSSASVMDTNCQGASKAWQTFSRAYRETDSRSPSRCSDSGQRCTNGDRKH